MRGIKVAMVVVIAGSCLAGCGTGTTTIEKKEVKVEEVIQISYQDILENVEQMLDIMDAVDKYTQLSYENQPTKIKLEQQLKAMREVIDVYTEFLEDGDSSEADYYVMELNEAAKIYVDTLRALIQYKTSEDERDIMIAQELIKSAEPHILMGMDIQNYRFK